MSRHDQELLTRARALQSRFGIVDLHVDSIIQQRLFGYDVRAMHSAGRLGQPRFRHADIPRMRQASYLGACMGIHYWPIEAKRGWREAMRQIDYLDRIADEDPDCLRASSPDDWDRAESEGLLALQPGIEGAHVLGGDLDNVDEMARRGVAYLTLAHFSRNSAATPALGRGANETDLLTPFGVELVRRLNAAGIVIDLAHVNDPGALHACEITTAPPLATHSGAKGVYPSPRLASDALIHAIAELDGAIGVIFAPNFLAGRLEADSRVVVDHIDYIANHVGTRHVAIGSDFDGWLPAIPNDMRDCRDIVVITAELLERGYTDDDIRGILGGNARRVFRAAWEARAR